MRGQTVKQGLAERVHDDLWNALRCVETYGVGEGGLALYIAAALAWSLSRLLNASLEDQTDHSADP